MRNANVCISDGAMKSSVKWDERPRIKSLTFQDQSHEQSLGFLKFRCACSSHNTMAKEQRAMGGRSSHSARLGTAHQLREARQADWREKKKKKKKEGLREQEDTVKTTCGNAENDKNTLSQTICHLNLTYPFAFLFSKSIPDLREPWTSHLTPLSVAFLSVKSELINPSQWGH